MKPFRHVFKIKTRPYWLPWKWNTTRFNQSPFKNVLACIISLEIPSLVWIRLCYVKIPPTPLIYFPLDRLGELRSRSEIFRPLIIQSCTRVFISMQRCPALSLLYCPIRNQKRVLQHGEYSKRSFCGRVNVWSEDQFNRRAFGIPAVRCACAWSTNAIPLAIGSVGSGVQFFSSHFVGIKISWSNNSLNFFHIFSLW